MENRLDNGAWHHIALSKHSGSIDVYLDGAKLGTQTTNGDTFWYGVLYFGNRNGVSNTGFRGLFDRARVYWTNLKAPEILALYNQDSDGDGLADRTEASNLNTNKRFLTSPLEWQALTTDTDRDGLTDLQEQAFRTDIFRYDTDSDGLSDGFERNNGLDPLNPFGVNGADGDADGDSLSNYIESLNGSNPLIYDTDGDGI